MKQRIAARLIRIARRLDPNSCVDFYPLPTQRAVINVGTHGQTPSLVLAEERLAQARRAAARAAARQPVYRYVDR